MKKITGVVAIIALAIGLTWAADQVGGWLGLTQQADPTSEEDQITNEDGSPGDPLGNEGILPSENATADEPATSTTPPELSAEVTSIEEDLARIEEALQSEEVLEEFTPSEPLSADNPIPFPTDI